MNKALPSPRWLTATTAIVLCFAVAAGYFGYLAYQTRNTTPYEHGSDQHNGWLYAEWNQFKDVSQCADTDGGWAALGIQTSTDFLTGCRAAIAIMKERPM